MSRRGNWTFKYSADEVAKAAEKKVEYHARRAAWWKNEGDQAKKEMMDTAELREVQVTGGVRMEHVYNQAAQNRFNEAVNKGLRHKSEAEEYKSFVQALGKETGNVELDVSDVVYFGLGKNGDEAE